MMNPASLLKMKGLLDKFNSNHPKVVPFLNTVNAKGITPGTIIEAKVTFPDGTEYVTNIKVNEEDMELVQRLAQINK